MDDREESLSSDDSQGDIDSESDISLDSPPGKKSGHVATAEGHASQGSDHELESKTTNSTISKDQGKGRQGPSTPGHSSVSDVSSENEDVGSPQTEKQEGDNWDRVTDTHFESDLTGFGSPKEEKLDYGGMEEDEHGNVLLSPDVNVSSGSHVLDRRKSSSPERDDDDAESIPQKEGDDDGAVDDVSEQSGEEQLGEEESVKNETSAESKVKMADEMMDNVSDQSEDEQDASVGGQKPESLAPLRDESMDSVSDQSNDEENESHAGDVLDIAQNQTKREDDSIDNVSEEEESAENEKNGPKDSQQKNESIDDVSEQSEDDDSVDAGGAEPQSDTPPNKIGPREMLDNVSDQSVEDSPEEQPPDQPLADVDNVSIQSDEESSDGPRPQPLDQPNQKQGRGGEGMMDDVSDEEQPQEGADGAQSQAKIGDVSEHSEKDEAVEDHLSDSRGIKDDGMDNVSDQSEDDSPREQQPEPPADNDDGMDNVSEQSGDEGKSHHIQSAGTGIEDESIDNVSDQSEDATVERPPEAPSNKDEAMEDINQYYGELMENRPSPLEQEGYRDDFADNVSEQSEDDFNSEQPPEPSGEKEKAMDNFGNQTERQSEHSAIKAKDMMDNVSDQSEEEFYPALSSDSPMAQKADMPPVGSVDDPKGGIANMSNSPAYKANWGTSAELSKDIAKDKLGTEMENVSSQLSSQDLSTDQGKGDNTRGLNVSVSSQFDKFDSKGAIRPSNNQGVADESGTRTDIADLDNVSDQSDLEDEVNVNIRGELRTSPQVLDKNSSVMDHSDSKAKAIISEGVDGGSEVVSEGNTDLKQKHVDDVSDTKDHAEVKKTPATAMSLTEDIPGSANSGQEQLQEETSSFKDAVMDVHHHGDELDFEEDVEERAGDEGQDQKMREGQEGQRETKPAAQGAAGDELESGEEEGETRDDDDMTGLDDTGEIEEEEETEEGEVREPDERRPNIAPRRACRFYTKGHCTWGASCRFLHPGFNDIGNYSFIDFKEIEQNKLKLLNKEPELPPPPAPVKEEESPPEEDYTMMEELLPPPPMSTEPPRESAWERGIRQAKEARKRLEERKAQGIQIQEEPVYHLEETFVDDFDMEAEFNPDLRRDPLPQPHGRYGEPDPQYNPRYQPREHHYNTGPPRREPPHPRYQNRPPPHYQEYRELPPRKDQFGRDYSKRQEMVAQERERRRQAAKQYQAAKPIQQERGRREERPRIETVPKKPADSWQDPWARNRSPKPKAKVQAKGRHRSGSLSSGSSGSRSRSRSYSSGSSRSSSASSYSSRSDSRSRSRSPRRPKTAGATLLGAKPPVTKTSAAKTVATKPVTTKPVTAKPFGLIPRNRPPLAKASGLVKMGLTKAPPVKLGLQPAPGKKPTKPPKRSMSNSSISSASRSPSPKPKSRPPQPGPVPPGGARRRRSSSGSSHVSLLSKSSADSEHMYANLASPVSSPSSSERISKKKSKAAKTRQKFPTSKPTRSSEDNASARPKQMVTVPSMEAFEDVPVQMKKSKPSHPKVTPQAKSKSTSAPAQMTRNPVKHSTHKEIKLTLLNKPSTDGKKRYEVLGDGTSKKVKPVAPVKPTTKVVPEKERRAVKPLQQTTKKQTPSAVVTPVRTATVKPSVSDRSERKRLPSPFKQREQPPAKKTHSTAQPHKTSQAHKTAQAQKTAQPHKTAPRASGASKSRDPAAVKKATISRREEILKQLKAVEDMIARKKAKMKN